MSSWVWGIDTGSLRCGLGFVCLDDGRFITHASEWRAGAMDIGRSLPLAGRQTGRFMSRLLHLYPPATVAVEKPSGSFQNPSLMMHAGVLVAAAAEATGMTPWLYNVTSWKQDLGFSSKWPKADLLPWAASLGYPLGDSDQAAALAIAAAAARKLYQVQLTTPLGLPVDQARAA